MQNNQNVKKKMLNKCAGGEKAEELKTSLSDSDPPLF